MKEIRMDLGFEDGKHLVNCRFDGDKNSGSATLYARENRNTMFSAMAMARAYGEKSGIPYSIFRNGKKIYEKK